MVLALTLATFFFSAIMASSAVSRFMDAYMDVCLCVICLGRRNTGGRTHSKQEDLVGVERCRIVSFIICM